MQVAINERLAAFRFSYLSHRVPGFRWIGKRLSPENYFNWVKWTSHLAYYGYPADWRRIRYMREAMKGAFSNSTVRTKARQNLLYRRWLRALINGWPGWAVRSQEWACIEGEEHLRSVLTRGMGAVLLSPHAYGLPTLVAPVLSRRGYKLNRTGQGLRGAPERRWGEQWPSENWQYNTYGKDRWQHLRALHKMRVAAKNNEILHLLVRGFPRGEPRLEIEFYYNKFFLDPMTFRLLETLQAPVLPCFAFCNDRGGLVIRIYPPLPAVTAAVVETFGPLYSRYLKEMPEFGNFWRRMVRQQEGW